MKTLARFWWLGIFVVGIALTALSTHDSQVLPADAHVGGDRNGINPQAVTPTIDLPRPTHQGFAGYTCTVDCGGHEAGYRWAEEHMIDDEEDCETAGLHSNSPSFAEGCMAYVNENTSAQADDGNDDSAADKDPE
jgi:hypothetical protein